jgi:hypothetical protein
VSGGTGNFKAATHAHPMNVKRTQAFLKAHGYAIPEDGMLGPMTEAAINDWHSGSKHRNPGRFNKVHGLIHSGPGGNSNPPDSDHSQRGGAGLGKGGVGPKGGGAGGGGGGSDPMGALGLSLSGDLKALGKLAMQGSAIPLSRLKQLGTPDQIAAHAANLKYGAALSGLGRDVTQARGQGVQNLADIASWFGQVRGDLDKATADDAASSERNIAAQDQANQGIISSLGGGANEGATSIAHESSNDAALMRMLAATQGNYDRAAQTQLGVEATSARNRQQNTDEQRVSDLLGKLRDMQTEKGAFQAQSTDEARQSILGDEMNIRQFNETLRGNKFQRAASIPGLRISAAMAGPQMEQAMAAVAQTKAGTKAINQGRSRTGAGGSRTGALTQAQLGKAVDTIVGHLRTPVTVQNPDGTKGSHGQFSGRPAQAASYVMTALRGYGIDPSTKQGRSLALQILASGVDKFNATYYNRLMSGLPTKRPKVTGPAGARGPVG